MTTNAKEILDMNDQIDDDLKTKVQFQIKTDLLKDAVKRVERSAERVGTVEVKKGIYIYVTDDELTVRAMNSEFGTQIQIQKDAKAENFSILEGTSGGAIFLDPKFPSFVSNLPRKTTTITIEGLKAHIKSGRASFNLNVLEPTQYPKFPQVTDGESISVPVDILSRLYNKTVFAAAASEMRPILTGVNHVVEEGVLRLEATDSHRLAYQQYRFSDDSELKVSKVLPAKTLQEIQKQLAKKEGSVTLYFNGTQLTFRFGDTMIYSRVLEETYPDISRLVPEGFQTEVKYRVADLKEMIKRALLVDQTSAAKFKVKATECQSRLMTREDEKSAFQEDLSALEGNGDDIQLGLNIRYVLDTLNHQPADSIVKMQFINKMKPFVIRNESEEDCNFDLILPVQIKDKDMQGKVVIENFEGDVQLEFLKEEEAAVEETEE